MNNAGPAICSLICPGLGQACQGRKLDGACHFFMACVVWVGTLGLLGWVVNLCSAFGAASWRPPEERGPGLISRGIDAIGRTIERVTARPARPSDYSKIDEAEL